MELSVFWSYLVSVVLYCQFFPFSRLGVKFQRHFAPRSALSLVLFKSAVSCDSDATVFASQLVPSAKTPPAAFTIVIESFSAFEPSIAWMSALFTLPPAV